MGHAAARDLISKDSNIRFGAN
uniref:Uncharacterized protein n=1 Tax=Anguilla anguilla TaxID=7936 RepID=A0A0E9QD41_ANGAN